MYVSSYSYPVPRLKISGAIPLLPLYLNRVHGDKINVTLSYAVYHMRGRTEIQVF
jgi:hypothetical protein